MQLHCNLRINCERKYKQAIIYIAGRFATLSVEYRAVSFCNLNNLNQNRLHRSRYSTYVDVALHVFQRNDWQNKIEKYVHGFLTNFLFLNFIHGADGDCKNPRKETEMRLLLRYKKSFYTRFSTTYNCTRALPTSYMHTFSARVIRVNAFLYKLYLKV
ncbi:hypothetical protein PUN28_014946 [Cardiocondyla obscurior]|uniref:Uncharacterized protein n=1 Tax=Cardiocondyla obscurior TaxID=286306 RepID=A0AAW2EYS4_9HYME